MNKRLIAAIAFITLVASSALAKDGVTRTIVVRDGKVISEQEGFPLDGPLFTGKRAYLGVSLNDITSELREHWGAPKDSGVLVEGIAEDSPAAKAGVHVGDIIVSVDGKSVGSSSDVRRALRQKKAGETARLEIVRNGARQTVVTTIVERETQRLLPLEIIGNGERLGRLFEDGEWQARVERLGDCGGLQSRIRELETRLRDLEKKLQK